jgi:hypothetical protein
MCFKSETVLGDLDPDHPLEIERPGKPSLKTTPRELITQARLPRFLTLDQVEFAFSE